MAAIALCALALAACGSDAHPVSGAFCSDLKSGLSLYQLYMPVKAKYTPSEFAERAYGYALVSCPEELKTNDALRGYLQAYGLNPDAQVP